MSPELQIPLGFARGKGNGYIEGDCRTDALFMTWMACGVSKVINGPVGQQPLSIESSPFPLSSRKPVTFFDLSCFSQPDPEVLQPP
jgi:hypothetical protein